MNNKELANFLQVTIRGAEMKTKEEVKKLLEENDLEGEDYSDSDIDHKKTKELNNVKYKVGDKVKMLDSIECLGLVEGSIYEINLIDCGPCGSIPTKLMKDDGRAVWVTSEIVELADSEDIPSKIYQLFEYYTHEENQDDVFVTDEGDKVVYVNGGVKVGGVDVTVSYYSSEFYTVKVKPYIECKEMTLEEIEKELGYKVEVI